MPFITKVIAGRSRARLPRRLGPTSEVILNSISRSPEALSWSPEE